MPRGVEAILAELFGSLSQPAGALDLQTNAGQAAYLNVSPAQLSRIRSGKRRLTEALATDFARKLLPDGSEDQRKTLADRLLALSHEEEETGPWSLHNVVDLFRRLSRERALLCVEYRDWPRAAPEGKYRQYAEYAREAALAGCRFAMFQPFGLLEAAEGAHAHGHHTKRVRAYLDELREEVRKACRAMRGEDTQSQTNESIDLKKRIVLYEKNAPEPFIGTGIQSRLFYAEITESDEVLYEVWEWVAAEGSDIFVRRDPESTPRKVIAEQFYPVVEYWREHGELPHEQSQLDHAARDYRSATGASIQKSPWTIWQE